MEKSLGDSFALILALLLLIIGGYVMVGMRRRSGLESFPSGEKRIMLNSTIAKMAAENQPRIEQLKYLRQQGLHKDIAEALLKDFERKHHAQPDNAHNAVPSPNASHAKNSLAYMQLR